MPAPSEPSARATPGIGMAVRVAGTIRTTTALAEPGNLGCRQRPGEADEQGDRGHRSAPGFTPPAGECSGDVRERGHRSAPGGAPPAAGCSGDVRERGHRSVPVGEPPAGECTGNVATGNTPAVPVASRSGAQAPGTGHAGAPLPRSELNGNASPFPAPSCAPVAAHGAGAGAGAGSAAPSSEEGPAPQLPPAADVPASASAPVPEPVVAPAESRRTASRASEPVRDDPFAELSPGTVSAAPLLHPQLQRELIEQAAGMSTRQVASLLAAAAPEVLPPRDTLRAVAPDRYTLKVSIDQECEQGLRLLKDLLSHVDPRMSWGDLVARIVRDAVARHDPRGGGSGQRRRRSAGSAGASPRRAPKETRAVGAACGPAQRVGEASGRAPNRTGAAGAAAGPAQRVDESSGRAPNRTRAAVAPAAPARRRCGAAPAPPGDPAATERQNPIGVLANAAPPSQPAPAAPLDGARAGDAPSGAPAATAAPQSAPAALLDGARAGGVPSGAFAATAAPQSAPAALLDGARAVGAPSGASAATSAPKFASGALADGSHAGTAVPGSPAATSAPERALGVSPDGGPSGASDGAAGVASAAGFSARAGVPGSPVATAAAKSVLGVLPDGGPPDASAGAAAHTTREPVHRRHQSRRGATFRRRSGATSGYATEDAAVIVIRSPGALHLVPSAADRPPVARRRGGWPGAVQPQSPVRSSSPNAPRLRTGCSAGAPDVALPARGWRATRLRWPTACRWPGGDTLRQRREPTVHLRYRLFRPGWSLSMRSCAALSWSPVNDFLPLPAFAPMMRWSAQQRSSGEGRAIDGDALHRCPEQVTEVGAVAGDERMGNPE